MERVKQVKDILRICSGKELTLPMGTNIIIDDVGTDEIWRNSCQQFLQPEVIFLEPDILSAHLAEQLEQTKAFDEKSVAVLYPKQGALSVRRTGILNQIPCLSESQGFEIETVRDDPNSEPFVELPTELTSLLVQGKLNTILIVDDVTVTGLTNRAIQEMIWYETDVVDESSYDPEIRFSWSEVQVQKLPLNWYSASWLVYASDKGKSRNLRDYSGIFSGISYKGKGGQPPVNSISSWAFDVRKGAAVLEAYAERYSTDPAKFITLVESLKGGEKA